MEELLELQILEVEEEEYVGISWSSCNNNSCNKSSADILQP